MKLVYRSLLAVGLCLGSVAGAQAGENSSAKILLHVGPVTTKNTCTSSVVAPPDCRNAVVTGLVGNAYNVYVCVANHSDSVGVAGVQFGITYDDNSNQGIDIVSWNNCSDLEFASANWPNATNTGTLLTWDGSNNCQLGGATTVAGYFYIGAVTADRLSLIPRPVDGAAKVADCNRSEENLTSQAPSALGYADFGTGSGYNPCQNIVPVETTTWSGVKSLFN